MVLSVQSLVCWFTWPLVSEPISSYINKMIDAIFEGYPVRTYIAFSVCMCIYIAITFIKVSFSDCGKIPFRTIDSSFSTYQGVQMCEKCEAKKPSSAPPKQFIKPIRAHHCKVCNQCSLKMDHHCPIVSNCVGLKNQRSYCVVLGTGLFALGILTSEMMYYVYYYLYPYWTTLERPQNIYYGIYYFYLCFIQWGAVTSVAALFFMHLRFAMINTTTIDNVKITAKTPNLFSLGVLYNLKCYFHSYWTCLIPIQPQYKYEGFYYPMVGHDPEINGIPLVFETSNAEPKAKTLDDFMAMSQAQIMSLITN